MELKHIPLDQLHLSSLNMRHGKRPPDVSDILPSVRARGILQPLLVRPNADGFEIVAGRRRYYSAKAVAAELGEIAPIPCAVMEAGDDAAALEASLIENGARLDPDEMSQYETFSKLIKEGRSVETIASTFGLTEIMVKQRLALGNLLPKIRDAYRAEQIDSETLRYLTMATKAQQKATTQKQIIRDALQGRNGRTKTENWLPGWMAFPFKPYSDGASRIGAISALVTSILGRT